MGSEVLAAQTIANIILVRYKAMLTSKLPVQECRRNSLGEEPTEDCHINIKRASTETAGLTLALACIGTSSFLRILSDLIENVCDPKHRLRHRLTYLSWRKFFI